MKAKFKKNDKVKLTLDGLNGLTGKIISKIPVPKSSFYYNTYYNGQNLWLVLLDEPLELEVNYAFIEEELMVFPECYLEKI